jgi:thrombospondin motif-containing protein 9
VLEYSGSDVVIERVTCSKPLQKDLILEVLTVGNVYPPQVRQYIPARVR